MIREKSELQKEKTEMIKARKAMRVAISDPSKKMDDYDEAMGYLIK